MENHRPKGVTYEVMQQVYWLVKMQSYDWMGEKEDCFQQVKAKVTLHPPQYRLSLEQASPELQPKRFNSCKSKAF